MLEILFHYSSYCPHILLVAFVFYAYSSINIDKQQISVGLRRWPRAKTNWYSTSSRQLMTYVVPCNTCTSQQLHFLNCLIIRSHTRFDCENIDENLQQTYTTVLPNIATIRHNDYFDYDWHDRGQVHFQKAQQTAVGARSQMSIFKRGRIDGTLRAFTIKKKSFIQPPPPIFEVAPTPMVNLMNSTAKG